MSLADVGDVGDIELRSIQLMPLGGPPLISLTKTAKSMICPGDHHADEQFRNKKDA